MSWSTNVLAKPVGCLLLGWPEGVFILGFVHVSNMLAVLIFRRLYLFILFIIIHFIPKQQIIGAINELQLDTRVYFSIQTFFLPYITTGYYNRGF